MSSPPPQSVESVFSRSWELLTRNWIILVPGIVIGAILGIVTWLLTPHYYTSTDYANNPGLAMSSMGNMFMAAAILGCVGIVANIVTTAITTGMAGAAWARGTTTIADGTAALSESGGNVVMTAIGLFLLGIVAVILAIPTLGLALLAFTLFTLYAMPSAIIGKQAGFSSIAESFRIATKRFVPTLIIAILLFVIAFVLKLVTVPLYFIPLLGPILSGVVSQAILGYAMLVIVGEYLNLRAAGALAPPAAPSAPI